VVVDLAGGAVRAGVPELREMRYLWRQPVRMSNARLLSVLGSEPHTPLDAAVQRTLRGLGC
jgi:nucleoside-diphosphate-sugar epimerase